MQVRLYQDGEMWIAEFADGKVTQGYSREEAIDMAQDLARCYGVTDPLQFDDATSSESSSRPDSSQPADPSTNDSNMLMAASPSSRDT